MRTIKRQVKQKEVSRKDLLQKEIIPDNIEDDKATIVSTSSLDLQVIQIEYQNKLDLLKKENKELKAKKGLFSANEEKVLNAIKSEKINQGLNNPILSRATFKTGYGLNEKYLGSSIDSLLESNMISRSAARKNGQKTFSWEILTLT